MQNDVAIRLYKLKGSNWQMISNNAYIAFDASFRAVAVVTPDEYGVAKPLLVMPLYPYYMHRLESGLLYMFEKRFLFFRFSFLISFLLFVLYVDGEMRLLEHLDLISL